MKPLKSAPCNVTLVLEFKEHLKLKNYSPASINSYWLNIINFLLWTEEILDKSVKEITKDDITKYGLHLNQKNYKPYTVQRYMYSLKKFFAWLEEKNYILISPMERMILGRVNPGLPVTLTLKEITRLIEQPNAGTMLGIRDRAILEVFYSTGIRIGELLNLTVFDIDTQSGFLRVNKGKFSKDRFAPLTKAACYWIKQYIEKVRPRHAKKDPREQILFLSRRGRKMNKETVSSMIRTYSREAGIKKKVTAHALRHTFATHLLENDVDIFKIQKLLGHKKATTTQRYTKVYPKEIKQAHAKYHPREKDKDND